MPRNKISGTLFKISDQSFKFEIRKYDKASFWTFTQIIPKCCPVSEGIKLGLKNASIVFIIMNNEKMVCKKNYNPHKTMILI